LSHGLAQNFLRLGHRNTHTDGEVGFACALRQHALSPCFVHGVIEVDDLRKVVAGGQQGQGTQPRDGGSAVNHMESPK
jgi:hypothetical protein